MRELLGHMCGRTAVRDFQLKNSQSAPAAFIFVFRNNKTDGKIIIIKLDRHTLYYNAKH